MCIYIYIHTNIFPRNSQVSPWIPRADSGQELASRSSDCYGIPPVSYPDLRNAQNHGLHRIPKQRAYGLHGLHLDSYVHPEDCPTVHNVLTAAHLGSCSGYFGGPGMSQARNWIQARMAPAPKFLRGVPAGRLPEDLPTQSYTSLHEFLSDNFC